MRSYCVCTIKSGNLNIQKAKGITIKVRKQVASYLAKKLMATVLQAVLATICVCSCKKIPAV